MRRTDDGRVYVVKTMRLVGEEDVREIYEKKGRDQKKTGGKKQKTRKHNKKKGDSPFPKSRFPSFGIQPRFP